MEDDFLIERLLYSGEGDALDFKLQQYPFESTDDDSKSSLLKDILAFANAWRTTTAYIVIGVRDGSKEIVGLDNNIDDSRLQQFVSAKVNRPIQFSYRSVDFRGQTLGLFTIPPQIRPFYSPKGFGKVRAGTVYVRRGSSTAEANPEEIAKMGESDSARPLINPIHKLSIIIEKDPPYVDTQKHNDVNITKTVLVGIKNTGNTHLTNCKIHFEATGDNAVRPERWLRMDAFSLNPGEERLVSLAIYGEPISSEQAGADFIGLLAPPSGNFWRPPVLPKDGGVVTITATSLECAPCTALCKMWIDGGKLKWDKI
ncbi:Divergent AAA domain [Burkholderia pseudomallei]|uniref:AlbA family DNA-binding domain-containing protein n=1 Tax=Burkholderia pseudomallei TaxID=28450 RepID=UPI0005E72388|nr:ATP-binding protein [Burkholderia pseudomallei]MBF3415639.1 ATP-binding protein [Burkholderia pseudomallei]MBF3630513.1 ATP-binding protein [Burkholderia pseudomallei]MBF3899569.1 ATP-binding protein [Burkholderia pseudomallei]CAJ2829769.1 Divergent AAA domain [Burkholderia pseudomallei]CAJ9733523.1 Divergent AAA domain [Burkholderia pseudomallei]